MGALLDYLKKHTNHSIRGLFSLWITQIIHGMAYMERKKFVHRDLAARNILMQSHSRVKSMKFLQMNHYVAFLRSKFPILVYREVSIRMIITFNRVTHRFQLLGKSNRRTKREKLSEQFRYAPESLAQSKFTSRSDVWSFGITAWEIYTFGQFPYGNMPSDEVNRFDFNEKCRIKRFFRSGLLVYRFWKTFTSSTGL